LTLQFEGVKTKMRVRKKNVGHNSKFNATTGAGDGDELKKFQEYAKNLCQ